MPDTYVLDAMKKHVIFCDLSVREKDWRAASQAFERMHNTLSHGVKIYLPGGMIVIVRFC